MIYCKKSQALILFHVMVIKWFEANLVVFFHHNLVCPRSNEKECNHSRRSLLISSLPNDKNVTNFFCFQMLNLIWAALYMS